MIALLRGIVAARNDDSVVIDVQGVGYQVFVPAPMVGVLLPGSEVQMHIHTSVREDSITLFGFTDVKDKDVFLSLTTVKGIGPKLAMAVMGGMVVAELVNTVAAGDVRTLTKIPGLGKKTAERIIVELRERFESKADQFEFSVGAKGTPRANAGIEDDVRSALSNLGFKSTHIDKVLAEIAEEPEASGDFDGLFRDALKRLR